MERQIFIKRMKRLSALLLALAMCGGLFAGCGIAGQRTEGEAEGGSGHPGVLNVHIETNVQSLDPQEATDGTSFEVIANFTDGLTQTASLSPPWQSAGRPARIS